MNFEIVESFIQGKSWVQECEDGWIATSHYVAVVDGATAKNEFQIDGRTIGSIATEIILEAITALSPELSVFEAIDRINKEMIRFYNSRQILDKVTRFPDMRCTASAAIYNHYWREVWLIGDCQCRIGECVFKNEKEIDRVLSEMRSLLLYDALERGILVADLQNQDIGRGFIQPMLKRQSIWQNNLRGNTEYCYSVLDGFSVYEPGVAVIQVDEPSVILGTDGYFELYGTLLETENALHYQIKTDPLCIGTYKTTKGVVLGNYSFDDRTYVRIRRF